MEESSTAEAFPPGCLYEDTGEGWSSAHLTTQRRLDGTLQVLTSTRGIAWFHVSLTFLFNQGVLLRGLFYRWSLNDKHTHQIWKTWTTAAIGNGHISNKLLNQFSEFPKMHPILNCFWDYSINKVQKNKADLPNYMETEGVSGVSYPWDRGKLDEEVSGIDCPWDRGDLYRTSNSY